MTHQPTATKFGSLRVRSGWRVALAGAIAVAQLAFAPIPSVRAQTTTIAQWTFDNDVTTPAIGSGVASLVGGTTATFATGFVGPRPPDSGWNTTNYPAQGTGSGTAGVQFAVSTVGFTNIGFSFNIRHSNTAANTILVQYSADGGATFTTAETFTFTPQPTGTGDTWYSRAVDLSAATALNNNPNAVFRVVSAFDPVAGQYLASRSTSTYASTGTMRFDNVTVVGVAGGPPPGDAAPGVVSTTPANGATGVAANTNIDIAFSEPVNAGATSFSIACTTSGAVAFNLVGGPTTFTLDPAADFAAGETCTVTVIASQVTDVDTDDPPDAMEADFAFTFTVAGSSPPVCSLPFTPIYQVQGSGETSPLAGQVVTVQGVVVGDYEGPTPNLRGFYIQDLLGDGNPATSDGVFVFNGNNDNVSVGQLVRVTGTAQEFQGQTQIGNVTAIEQCGTTASVAPVDVLLPFPSADYLERFEGMLVRLPQTLYVTEHFQLGRFGQITMSSGGRLFQPTQLAAPGAPALAIQAANDLNRIIVDDSLNNQNPDPIIFGGGTSPLAANNTLRIGDTATGIVGMMTFTWAGNAASGNAYRVRPTVQPTFVSTNPRPARPANVGGTLKVAGANILNYFNTFGAGACALGVGGAPADCRGAENAAEFDRQVAKTVAMLVGTGADIIALAELENDGYGPNSAIADLVNRLNAATAPGTFAFIDADAGTGQVNALGVDAIKVGIVYKPAKVKPVGNTAVLNTGAFGLFTTTGGVIQRNRPPLAQTFEQLLTGERLTVVANHLKSKGSPCADNVSPVGPDPDLGDGQGNCNLTRKAAAEQMAAWLATNPTGVSTPHVLIMGDLNAYAQEDPITALKNAGYINLIEQRLGPNSYSFVFNGQSGYLDYAMASPAAAARVTGVTEWHVNADEPNVLDYNLNFKSAGQQVSLYAPDAYRSSDHDPVIVGLNLNTPSAITALETYDTGLADNGAEIVSVAGDRAVLSNAGDGSVDVLDVSDPLDIKLIRRVKVPELAGLNSVAIHPTKDYFLAVAGTAKPAASPVNGKLLAFRLSDGALIAQADVGIQPDSVAISPDGNFAVVANEAEAPSTGDNGGPGSLSVIALSGFDPATPGPLSVTQIALPSQSGTPGFSAGRFDDIGRLPIDNAPGTLEPESVAFSPDSQFAYITLQENNGVVRLDLANSTLAFFGLGQTSHLADLTNGGGYNPVEVLTAFREPDGIAVIEIGGVRYFVTADEGDTRPSAGSAGLRGGRTMSVFDANTGALISDTAGQLDDIAAARGVYPDSRSNRGGSEPEVLDAIVFNGRAIVAVGLERANGVALVDITNPAAPRVYQLISTGVAPEGIKLVVKNGALYVFAANEVSGTLSVARVAGPLGMPEGDAIFTQRYAENTPLALNDLAVIDPDAGDVISVRIEVDRAYGALNTGTAGGTTSTYDANTGIYLVSGPLAEVNALLAGLVYTPRPNYAGTVPLTVTVNDGHGPDVIGVITLVGIAVNEPPVGGDDTLLTYQYLPVAVKAEALLANDTDPDGDSLTIVAVSMASASGGSVTFDGNAVRYAPPGAFVGTDSFTYTVSDGQGGLGVGTVTVIVQPLPPQVKPVRPVLACVAPSGHRQFTAYFTYRNDNAYPVVIPVGPRNRFLPAPHNRNQPTIFLPGRQGYFAVEFRTPFVTWVLDGRVETATWFSKRCR
ncbi:MAG: ExeM/NucH family extracellular endonuclease [Anaerolineae bacterium]|nr:ExeM/NucH family extracellular endonuclease [Anaerolineae bacterium]